MTALFREILSMSLSAGFLVALVIGARWCFRRAPKWVHCILWALVAVRLLVPSLPQSQLSMVPERVSDSQAVVEWVGEMPQFRPAPEVPSPAPLPQAPSVPEAEAPAPSAPVELPEAAPAPAPKDWMSVLARVWMAGVIAMILYALLSYCHVRRQVAASMGIGGGVYLCDYVSTPFLLGLIRPRIYLPSGLDEETAAYVLSHERAHLARRDHWWKPLGFLLLSIHWFNPMIWLGYVLLCRDIEMACDEAVIRTMGPGEKKGYSTALLRCSVPRHAISVCPLAFGEVSVKERIHSVLNYKRPALWLTLLGLTAAVLGAVFFLTDPKEAPEEVEYYRTAIYNEEFDELTLYEYDDQFRRTKATTYESGVEKKRGDYTYEQQGDTLIARVVWTDLIYFNTSDGRDSMESSEEYIYHTREDAQGNVVEKIEYQKGEWYATTAYSYDENGNKLSEERTTNTGSSLKTWEYDENDNILRYLHNSKRFDNADTSDPLPTMEVLCTYDENGNQLTDELYWYGKLYSRTEFTWDGQGRLLSKLVIEPDRGQTLSSYSYDEDSHLTYISSVSEVDGTSRRGVCRYDEHENLLQDLYTGRTGERSTYYNYIGTDGSVSIGIPAEIYDEGLPAPNPRYRYTTESVTYSEGDGLYGFRKDLEFTETEFARFWFDPGVYDELRRECIDATKSILWAFGSDIKPDIYILSGKDYGSRRISGNSLYTVAKTFHGREYAAEVLMAASGEMSHYGLAYGYANLLCDRFGWQTAEKTSFPRPACTDIADLNTLCFKTGFASSGDIQAAKALSCGFAQYLMERRGEDALRSLLEKSGTGEGMKALCDELENYYAANGLHYRPTELRFGFGGVSLDYTVASEPATFRVNKDWVDVWAPDFRENFLHRDYSQVKEYFETHVEMMKDYQQYLGVDINGTTVTLINRISYSDKIYWDLDEKTISMGYGVSLMSVYARYLTSSISQADPWAALGLAQYLVMTDPSPYVAEYNDRMLADPDPRDQELVQFVASLGRPFNSYTDLATFAEINCAYRQLHDPKTSASQAGAFVKYLADTYGEETVKDHILRGAPLPKPYEELVADWVTYLDDTYGHYGTYRP